MTARRHHSISSLSSNTHPIASKFGHEVGAPIAHTLLKSYGKISSPCRDIAHLLLLFVIDNLSTLCYILLCLILLSTYLWDMICSFFLILSHASHVPSCCRRYVCFWFWFWLCMPILMMYRWSRHTMHLGLYPIVYHIPQTVLPLAMSSHSSWSITVACSVGCQILAEGDALLVK